MITMQVKLSLTQALKKVETVVSAFYKHCVISANFLWIYSDKRND